MRKADIRFGMRLQVTIGAGLEHGHIGIVQDPRKYGSSRIYKECNLYKPFDRTREVLLLDEKANKLFTMFPVYLALECDCIRCRHERIRDAMKFHRGDQVVTIQDIAIAVEFGRGTVRSVPKGSHGNVTYVELNGAPNYVVQFAYFKNAVYCYEEDIALVEGGE